MPDSTASPHRYTRCIMGTCCVPWTADFRFDETMFRKSVQHALRDGTQFLYIFGTAGEGHAVSDRQFREISTAFADEMNAGNATPMVGLINTSLSTVLDRIDWAMEQGIRQYQISLPSWGTCNESEAFTFFEQVCTRFPDASFLHYNLRRAGRLLSAAEYGRLAAAFPNLVAVKMAGATGEDALAVQQAAPSLRLFLTEKAFAEACALGVEAGFLISYASLSWPVARRYYDANLAAGKADEVAKMRDEQTGVLDILRASTGSGPHMDGAFDLLFVKRYLPEFPLRLLPPYSAVTDQGFHAFLSQVAERYPHWIAAHG